MTIKFNHIGIIGKPGDASIAEPVNQLISLLTSLDCQVILDKTTAASLDISHVPGEDRNQIGQTCDLLIIIGGDGTLLDAARSMADYEIPMIGINLGRLSSYLFARRRHEVTPASL